MDAIIQHLQEHMAIYVVAVVVVLPLLYAFRYWTFPVIFHAVEGVFYFACVHMVIAGLVRFFQYFKSQTEMENALGPGEAQAAFTTPVNFNFWQKDLYNPEWLFFLEIAAILGIAYVVLKLRPVNYKRKNRYQGKKAQGAKAKKNPAFDYGNN